LPDCDSDEDEDFKQQDKELKACLPFAVVGSNTILEVNGKKMRGRQYEWGLVEGIYKLFCCYNIMLKLDESKSYNLNSYF